MEGQSWNWRHFEARLEMFHCALKSAWETEALTECVWKARWCQKRRSYPKRAKENNRKILNTWEQPDEIFAHSRQREKPNDESLGSHDHVIRPWQIWWPFFFCFKYWLLLVYSKDCNRILFMFVYRKLESIYLSLFYRKTEFFLSFHQEKEPVYFSEKRLVSTAELM